MLAVGGGDALGVDTAELEVVVLGQSVSRGSRTGASARASQLSLVEDGEEVLIRADSRAGLARVDALLRAPGAAQVERARPVERNRVRSRAGLVAVSVAVVLAVLARSGDARRGGSRGER